jgi:Skp family chaperone for outer membrane proteins
VLALAVPVRAQNAPVILVVDVGQVFTGSTEAQAEQMKFQSLVEGANKEISDLLEKRQAMITKAQELQRNVENATLTADVREGYKTQLQKAAADIQSNENDINQLKAQSDDLLSKRRATIVKLQIDKIHDAVADVAKKHNATLVLNSTQNTAVVFSAPNLDITKEVIDYVNANAPAGSGAASPSGAGALSLPSPGPLTIPTAPGTTKPAAGTTPAK